MSHTHSVCCPHCNATTRYAGAPSWARVAYGLTWLALTGMLCGAVLTGFLVVVFGPLVAVLGAPVLSYFGQLMDIPALCERCRKVLPETARRIEARGVLVPARAVS